MRRGRSAVTCDARCTVRCIEERRARNGATFAQQGSSPHRGHVRLPARAEARECGRQVSMLRHRSAQARDPALRAECRGLTGGGGGVTHVRTWNPICSSARKLPSLERESTLERLCGSSRRRGTETTRRCSGRAASLQSQVNDQRASCRVASCRAGARAEWQELAVAIDVRHDVEYLRQRALGDGGRTDAATSGRCALVESDGDGAPAGPCTARACDARSSAPGPVWRSASCGALANRRSVAPPPGA